MGTIFTPGLLNIHGTSPPPTPPKGRNQVVPLNALIQVIKGTFFNPMSGKVEPLPPHQWEVQKATDNPDEVMRGSVSDKQGISKIHNGTLLFKAGDDDEWYLVLRPKVTGDELGSGLRAGEFWIDLKRKTWITASITPSIMKIRAVRIPIWTSRFKARSGKVDSTPHFGPGISQKFKEGGTFTTKELQTAFGTLSSPWEVQIDLNWKQTFLRFDFYDVKGKTRRPVPPGLVVLARGEKTSLDGTKKATPRTVGAGVSIDDDGTVYVLHERRETESTDVDYAFRAPEDEYMTIDLNAAAPSKGKDARVLSVTNDEISPDVRTRYLLPRKWHSRGWEAAKGTTRKLFKDQRGEATTKSDPLIFDLDDTVLVVQNAEPPTLPTIPIAPATDGTLTIFDHAMKIVAPDATWPHLWKNKIKGPYLRGPDIIDASASPEHQDTPFVFNNEANFFVQREQRITGPIEQTDFVGARAAVVNDAKHVWAKEGLVEYHLFADADDRVQSPGAFLGAHPDAIPCHLLVYISIATLIGSGATQADLDTVVKQLPDIAAEWDQTHPAYGTAKMFETVVIPQSGYAAKGRVVLFRHFFGTRTDGNNAFTLKLVGGLPDARSFVQGPIINIFTTSNGLKVLAHEYGHTMRMPDEYTELHAFPAAWGISNLAEPRMSRFIQRNPAYPYYADVSGRMRGLVANRLRYFWYPVHFLNNNSAALDALNKEGPWLASTPGTLGGVSHLLEDGNAQDPWNVVGTRTSTSGRATGVLFRTGDDEGMDQTVFTRPAAVGTKFDAWMRGILVVRSLFWFDFSESQADATITHVDRFRVLQNFQRAVALPPFQLQQNFYVSSSVAGARMPKIGILFEPRFEYSLGPQPGATAANADCIIKVLMKTTPADRNVFPDGKTLILGKDDVGTCLLRFALGRDPLLPGTTPTFDNTPLTEPDLDDLAKVAAGILGDTGARTILPIV